MLLSINKYFWKKAKAGALQYTIVFSLLILMSLSLFLLYVRLSSLEVYSSQVQAQLIENCYSAVVILEHQPQLFEKQKFQICLLEDSTYITEIEISEWGFYHKVKVMAKKGRMQLSKIYLFADNIKKEKSLPSLYFPGAMKYLSLGGKSYLGNNTFLPGKGIRKSYNNGIGYNRDSLVHGQSFHAAETLPKLNTVWEERYRKLKSKSDSLSASVNLSLLNRDSITVSFNDQTLAIRCPANYIIKDKYISGNVLITGTNIRITSSSLHGCIIVADTIVTGKQFRADAQIIAQDYIEIGESSLMNAPSILYLNNSDRSDQVTLKSGTQFMGEVIIPQPNPGRKEILSIEEGCQIMGQIYCNGYASFEGTLFGSFYTTGFIKKSRNGLYENYLLDVCIDSRRMADEYCGISLIDKSNAKVCSQEVY
ncbi:MAG TPA: hypothetical protein VK205_14585 [Prolixibacteraceae bacterium]|nr:hypothetical protein [Prolixibacteraceae bacterium]